MNKPLIRQIIKIYDETPHKLRMSTYYNSTDECGTTACVAGHAFLCCGYTFTPGMSDASWAPRVELRDPNGKLVDRSEWVGLGQKLLDLTDDEMTPEVDGEIQMFLFYDTEESAIARLRALVEA